MVECVYLAAHIIQVVFPLHLEASGGKNVSQGATQNGATSVTHMKRSGRINANKFKLNTFSVAYIDIPI
ncbi:hypothetical protein ES703_72076 [subsurface metagenome]